MDGTEVGRVVGEWRFGGVGGVVGWNDGEVMVRVSEIVSGREGVMRGVGVVATGVKEGRSEWSL